MPKVTYVQPDGSETVLDLPVGSSVMRGAVTGGVRGIVAECGGNRMCATCHVYVDEDSADAFPAVSDDEDELLDCTAAPRRDTSRLSCQLVPAPDTADVVVRIPESQT
jgi:2Fe-2S ferredoxin